MKKSLQRLGILAALLIFGVIGVVALTPWMDRWGAADSEVAAPLPGDELVPRPAVLYTRSVTVEATPQQIYPWIAQLGAEKGGMYSYTWFETYVLHCELVNADRVHMEWQDLKVGDQVKMCPGNFGPPPYVVAQVEPNRAVVLGHYENGRWMDVWQFVLVPRSDGTTRLILRSRDMKTGGIWAVIRPGEFIMSRGMLLGIKERAEAGRQAALR